VGGDRRNGVARRQRYDMLAPPVEEWVDLDNERACLLLDESGEGGVNFAVVAGLDDLKLHPFALAASCTLLVSDFATPLVGFTRKAITPPLGASSCSNSSCFGTSCLPKETTPVTLPPGWLRLATRAKLNRVAACLEHDRNRRGQCLGRECCRNSRLCRMPTWDAAFMIVAKSGSRGSGLVTRNGPSRALSR
jgi:hypothetical protein